MNVDEIIYMVYIPVGLEDCEQNSQARNRRGYYKNAQWYIIASASIQGSLHSKKCVKDQWNIVSLSSLHGYIKALGGRLDILTHFSGTKMNIQELRVLNDASLGYNEPKIPSGFQRQKWILLGINKTTVF